MIRNIANKNHGANCKNKYYDELNSQSSGVLKTQMEFTELSFIIHEFYALMTKIVKMTKIPFYILSEHLEDMK